MKKLNNHQTIHMFDDKIPWSKFRFADHDYKYKNWDLNTRLNYNRSMKGLDYCGKDKNDPVHYYSSIINRKKKLGTKIQNIGNKSLGGISRHV